MRITDILKKLRVDKKEFVKSAELKEYCKIGGLDYNSTIKYLEERKYLIRIFRGIFYIQSVTDYHSGHENYNHLEFVAKGLELKGVTNWYYGLHTALQLNNMTHEYFVIDDILNDSIFRQNTMTIKERKYNFRKISKKLFNFGIKNNGIVKYSDPEKTILDFIYLWKYNGKHDRRIINDLSDWTKNISIDKIRKYSRHYPNSTKQIIEMI